MLGWRVAVSAILIPLLAGLFFLDHRAGSSGGWLLGLVLVIAARGTWEFADLLSARSIQISFPVTAPLVCGTAACGWAASFAPAEVGPAGSLAALGPILLGFVASLLTLFFVECVRFRAPGATMERLGGAVLAVAYLGVLLAMTAQLRWVAGASMGYFVLGSLVIAVKAGDIGGYTLGRLFGRRKMAPTLSPGKTWAGAAGAVLGAMLGATLWLRFAPALSPHWSPAPWWAALVFGAVMGVIGLIGDLCESLIKRDVGRKDAAALFPGFGGLLDLIDSIVYSGPVAWMLWKLLPLSTAAASPIVETF